MKGPEEEYSSLIKADAIETLGIQALNDEVRAIIVFECTCNICSNLHKNIDGSQC